MKDCSGHSIYQYVYRCKKSSGNSRNWQNEEQTREVDQCRLDVYSIHMQID